MKLILLACIIVSCSVVYCQDACERIITDVLGNSDTFEAAGLVATSLNPGGDSVDPDVRIIDMNIVCEAQHEMEDRYRYTSVVVSFNCFSTDVRISECNDSSTVHTEQFDFGCAGGTWTTNILSISGSARTTNPTATLTTELDTGCILCINPNNTAIGSRIVSDVTHCESCSNCPMGLQRCYYNAAFSEVCCNIIYQGVCSTECPSGLAANPLTEFTCEMRCPELSDTNGDFDFTNGRFIGSVATLNCNPGFEASGTNPVMCQASAEFEWTGLPTCEGPTAVIPTTVTAGPTESPDPPIAEIVVGVLVGVLLLIAIIIIVVTVIVVVSYRKFKNKKEVTRESSKAV